MRRTGRPADRQRAARRRGRPPARGACDRADPQVGQREVRRALPLRAEQGESVGVPGVGPYRGRRDPGAASRAPAVDVEAQHPAPERDRDVLPAPGRHRRGDGDGRLHRAAAALQVAEGDREPAGAHLQPQVDRVVGVADAKRRLVRDRRPGAGAAQPHLHGERAWADQARRRHPQVAAIAGHALDPGAVSPVHDTDPRSDAPGRLAAAGGGGDQPASARDEPPLTARVEEIERVGVRVLASERAPSSGRGRGRGGRDTRCEAGQDGCESE